MDIENKMEKQKEKKLAYKTLVELTKKSDPGMYFSRFKILEEIKDKIMKENGLEWIHYRSGYKVNYSKNSYGRIDSEKVKIDLDDILPKKKTLPIALEELVSEGKAKKIVAIDQAWPNMDYYKMDNCNGFYYRAILGEENGK